MKACMCICEYMDVYVCFVTVTVYTFVYCQLVNKGIVYFDESIKEEGEIGAH